jgi:polysaccharide export outer membrane protein
VVLASAVLGCATERPFVWVQDLPPARADADGTINPRDTIAVVILDQPAMSGEFVVHDDGAYLQPTLGNVMVQGRSPAEIAADLQRRLTGMIVNPRAAVSIVHVATIRVSVVGEVRTPGPYELNRDRTLAGALAAAGWLTDFAGRDRVFVVRHGDGETRVRFPVRDVTAPDSRSARFRLRDGDVVVVE